MRAHEIILDGYFRKTRIAFGDEDLLVFVDPSSEQVQNLLRRSKYKTLRGHLDSSLLVWNADDATHDHIDDTGDFGKLFGIRFLYSPDHVELYSYGRGEPSPMNPDTFEPFESKEEILDYAKNDRLMRAAFPGARFYIR